MNVNGNMILIDRLSFEYEKKGPEILSEVSLAIKKGAITALLGPNGSGKTTLLNIFLGWLSPKAGAVLVAGKPREEYSRRELSRLVGLVPQEESLAFEINLIEYVLLGRAPFLRLLELPGEEDRQAAMKAMDKAGLTAFRDRLVHSLSCGERQLASVARALSQDPPLLLLDEPTSHLDIGNSRRILGVLDALRREGKTIVFTTHDPNEASALADDVILINGGRILESGKAGEVLNSDRLSAAYGVEVEVRRLDGRALVFPRL